MIPWSRFCEIVRGRQRFVLTTHIRPDGDALGSEVALAEILSGLGKDVRVCNAFAVPPNLRFLDPQRRLCQLGVDLSAEQLRDREVLVILDTTAWAQLGAMAEVVKTTKALKVVLDHHVSGDDLGAELFKDVDAEATGCLVIQAADQLGVRLTSQIVRPAFVALATDTGWFRFSSTTSGTLRLAARLVEAGAAPDQLYKELYENDSYGRLQLIGRALPAPDRVGRPIDLLVDRPGGFRRQRGLGFRERGHHQHAAVRARHGDGRDPGRATRRQFQDQSAEPLPGGLQHRSPRSLPAAGTARPPGQP